MPISVLPDLDVLGRVGAALADRRLANALRTLTNLDLPTDRSPDALEPGS